MKSSMIAMALLAGFSINTYADEAQLLEVTEEVVINAPAAKVWAKVANFNDLGAWHPAVKTTKLTSGNNNHPGAVRLLTLQDDGTIQEKLLAHDAKHMTFKYSILSGVLPVSSYESILTVKTDGANQSYVTWSGKFKRKDTSSAPAAGQGDEDATKTISAVYRGGLDNLKKITE